MVAASARADGHGLLSAELGQLLFPRDASRRFRRPDRDHESYGLPERLRNYFHAADLHPRQSRTFVRLGGALRLGTADAKLSLVGSASFETDTLDVTIPQATYAARRPTEVLDLSGATVATLPETVRVRTEDGTDVTARTRPAFEKGRLLLFPPRGFAILFR